ncbi:MAG: hypothetical protein ACI4SN_07840 [Lachnospiraceae bacterium]
MTLNISTGNSVWWMVIALCCAVTALLYLLLRKKNEEQKRKGMLFIGYASMILLYVHKFLNFRYDAFVSAYGNVWERILTELLPLNLCYLGMVLMIIGAHLKNKYLLGFCFYISSIGAVLALVAPVGVFTDTNLLQPAVGMFYFLHILVAAAYWNIGFLGLVKPGKVMAITSLLLLNVIYLLVHIVNWLGRSVGINYMNYFFTFDPEGSSVLELLWKWVPVTYLYLLVPGNVFFAGWAVLLTLLYRCGVFLRKGKVRMLE